MKKEKIATISPTDPLKAPLIELQDVKDFAPKTDSYIKARYDLVLKDIELVIPRGSCVGIIGKVGSGKSSLLSALVGEVFHEPGSQVSLAGSVAYVP